MFEIFKTILLLSLLGGGLSALLLLFKPLTRRWFPANWQVAAWLIVMLSMVLPVWQWIPRPHAGQAEQYQVQPQPAQPSPEHIVPQDIPLEYREVPLLPTHSLRLVDLVAYVWLGGVGVYLVLAVGSYAAFVYTKRRHARPAEDMQAFAEVLGQLHIRRNIRLRYTGDDAAPMLVGIFRPVVYLPQREIHEDSRRMIFLHELTHYKRGDLVLKWLCMFINALHWFNPLCYMACTSLSEACEVACDMDVTNGMQESQQSLYMKTILDLVKTK